MQSENRNQNGDPNAQETPDAAASARQDEPAGQATAPEPTIEQRLADAEARAEHHHDQWLRAMADVENIRKRAQEDLAKAHKFAIEGFASELLPVRDSLEATLAAENATPEALKSGVELTLKQLVAVFDKSNLREVNPAGEKFDPHKHQAISMLPSEKEPNTVINVLQKGYVLHDRVIRPALVTVSKSADA